MGYEFVAGIISICVGISAVVFSKKLVALQKKQARQDDSVVGRKITNAPEKQLRIYVVITGIAFVLFGVISLL